MIFFVLIPRGIDGAKNKKVNQQQEEQHRHCLQLLLSSGVCTRAPHFTLYSRPPSLLFLYRVTLHDYCCCCCCWGVTVGYGVHMTRTYTKCVQQQCPLLPRLLTRIEALCFVTLSELFKCICTTVYVGPWSQEEKNKNRRNNKYGQRGREEGGYCVAHSTIRAITTRANIITQCGAVQFGFGQRLPSVGRYVLSYSTMYSSEKQSPRKNQRVMRAIVQCCVFKVANRHCSGTHKNARV